MTSCQCDGIEACFNSKYVNREVARYRKKGPIPSTRRLLASLEANDLSGMTLLDIGGGVGAIQHELLGAGVTSATVVDASTAYLGVARDEAQRRHLAERIQFEHGNFVTLAPDVPDADIVTLDRVLCCYDDVDSLVNTSAAHARRFYGLVYPRPLWYLRAYVTVESLLARIRRNSIRFFVHDPERVDAIVRKHGLERHSYATSGSWQVVVYARP